MDNKEWLQSLKDSLITSTDNLSCPVILKIHTFEELASTMDVSHNKQTLNPATSLEYKLNFENEVFSTPPEVYLSRYQAGGRGRLQRPWVSAKDKGIYLTIAFDLKENQTNFSGYSLAVGVAIVKTLSELGFNLGLKWPNDIYTADGYKVGGVLVETKSSASFINQLILGVGLNVFQQNYPEELKAKSLEDLMHRNAKLSYFQIVSHLLRRVVIDTQYFIKYGFQYFKEDWNNYSVINNRSITLLPENSEVIAVEVDTDGGLIVDQQGRRRVLYQGEISVRL